MLLGLFNMYLYLNGENIIVCYCVSFSNSVFSDFLLVAWNGPLQEYLHHRNWQALQTGLFYFFRDPVVKYTPANHWNKPFFPY